MHGDAHAPPHPKISPENCSHIIFTRMGLIRVKSILIPNIVLIRAEKVTSRPSVDRDVYREIAEQHRRGGRGGGSRAPPNRTASSPGMLSREGSDLMRTGSDHVRGSEAQQRRAGVPQLNVREVRLDRCSARACFHLWGGGMEGRDISNLLPFMGWRDRGT